MHFKIPKLAFYFDLGLEAMIVRIHENGDSFAVRILNKHSLYRHIALRELRHLQLKRRSDFYGINL